MALEMQKLQREHNFNPVLGCLPMLAQVPVFIGLFHVLRSFNRTQHGVGQLGLDVEVNKELPNYFFSALDVQNFLAANFHGAPLGATMIQHDGLKAFGLDPAGELIFSRPAVIAVGVPLMIAAGIATYFNSRASISRQSPEAAANPQTALMNKLALYVFPLGVVVGGPFLPLAIIVYWFSNNIWTFGQQHYVFGKIAQEDEKKKEEQLARRAANAPAPGAKPTKPRKGGAAAATEVAGEITESAGSEESATEGSEADGGSVDDVSSGGSPGGDKPRPGASPRPGARPQRKKKR